MSGVCVAPDEMSESRQTHVTLHDIDPQALEQLVQYAYTAEIVVGEGNVQVGASPQNLSSPQNHSVPDLAPGGSSLPLLSTFGCCPVMATASSSAQGVHLLSCAWRCGSCGCRGGNGSSKHYGQV